MPLVFIFAEPEEQHPHPFAPPELKEHFSDFLKKFQSIPATASNAGASAGTGSAKVAANGGQVFEEFWKAPSKLWKRDLEEWEIELVQVRSSSFSPRNVCSAGRASRIADDAALFRDRAEERLGTKHTFVKHKMNPNSTLI